MKKIFPYSLLVIFILAFALSGCGGGNSGGNSGSGGGNGNGNSNFSIAESLVPGAASFPTGIDDTGTCTTVNYPYYMARTEITYQLWSTVYTWATAHGYTFANSGGRGGYYNNSTLSIGAYNSGHETDPVTMISWYDSIIWCNALTEYYNEQNKTSLGCVYKSGSSPLRSATDTTTCDAVVPDQSAKGFRLPTSMEWELAARYKDGSTWTPGNYASGATADYSTTVSTQAVAWYRDDSNVPDSNVNSTQPVGTKTANALGIYDMSGNVEERCFDIGGGSSRVFRGGCWFIFSSSLQVGSVGNANPNGCSLNWGFRPVRNK